VIAETYERIHRSNLVGMGVLPLQFVTATTARASASPGTSSSPCSGIAVAPAAQEVDVEVARADGSTFTFRARVRIDTLNELEYFRAGGILHYVLRRLAA
jgi:aconitate hydratase